MSMAAGAGGAGGDERIPGAMIAELVARKNARILELKAALDAARARLVEVDTRVADLERALRPAVSHLQRHHKAIGIIACEIITDAEAVLAGEPYPDFDPDEEGA